MTLTSEEGSPYAKTVTFKSASALEMKSLVHAYFVRYVLPKRAKAKEQEVEQVVPFVAS